MNKNRKITTYFVIFSLLLIGIIYAILQANLQINGTAKIGGGTWDIHFDNVQINENSVPIGSEDSPATIDPTDNCKVDFTVTLSLPGDFYEFTVDVVNAGTVDGMIGTLTKTIKVNNEIVSEVPDYLIYTVTYSDGLEILDNHMLSAGTTETYLVRLEFKSDIEELPDSATIETSLESEYVQADSSSVPVREPADFVEDSWADIIDSYNVGNISKLQQAMAAGTVREVQLDLNNDGTPDTTMHLRIANLSKPAECSTAGFSQSACGFVLEFADVFPDHVMNPGHVSYKGTYYEYGWNIDGWPASSMYSYVNTDIFNALPEDLRSVIINTSVVSSHGSSSGETNFTSTDKLYLLSTHEIYEDVDGNPSSGLDYYDTAYDNTRQLDYYANLNVTSSSFSGAIKQNTSWWLRTASSKSNTGFLRVYSTTGSVASWGYGCTAATEMGVSPAFRIAS